MIDPVPESRSVLVVAVRLYCCCCCVGALPVAAISVAAVGISERLRPAVSVAAVAAVGISELRPSLLLLVVSDLHRLWLPGRYVRFCTFSG